MTGKWLLSPWVSSTELITMHVSLWNKMDYKRIPLYNSPFPRKTVWQSGVPWEFSAPTCHWCIAANTPDWRRVVYSHLSNTATIVHWMIWMNAESLVVVCVSAYAGIFSILTRLPVFWWGVKCGFHHCSYGCLIFFFFSAEQSCLIIFMMSQILKMWGASTHTQESGGCGRGPESELKLSTANLARLIQSKVLKLNLTLCVCLCLYTHIYIFIYCVYVYICIHKMYVYTFFSLSIFISTEDPAAILQGIFKSRVYFGLFIDESFWCFLMILCTSLNSVSIHEQSGADCQSSKKERSWLFMLNGSVAFLVFF